MGGAARTLDVTLRAVFPNESWKKFEGSFFHCVMVTDSIPGNMELLSGRPPFKVLSLAEDIARLIRGALED